MATNYPDGRIWLHHGDCVGFDAQAQDITLASMSLAKIYLHPASASSMHANKVYHKCAAPKPALQRNHDIVDASEILLAAPLTDTEVLRSGTWATIRYARAQGKPHVIFWPNGKIEVFPAKEVTYRGQTDHNK
jgi:hypothetical protein